MMWGISCMSDSSQSLKNIIRERGAIYAVYPTGSDYITSPRLNCRSKKPINIEIYNRRCVNLQFRILHRRHRTILIKNTPQAFIGADQYISDAYYKRPHYAIRQRKHFKDINIYAYDRRKYYV